MPSIKCSETGLIYRNPKPHVQSLHAYFPSVVQLMNGNLVSTMSIGQAFEAEDLHVNISTSKDKGSTWTLEGPMLKGEGANHTSDCTRISMTDEGELVSFLIKYNRSREGEGLTNPENLGFVETELFIARSNDGGQNWSALERIEPPLVGPNFEMNSPITFLKDGRWLLPTSTWRGWDGYCPNGMKAVAFVSYDCGKTWTEYVDVMKDTNNQIIYWESKVLELKDKRLLAVSWAYNEKEKCDLHNQYAISNDYGKSFSKPMSTGLIGQTLTPILLDDGRVLSVYRRMDKTGLWANISRIDGDMWVNEKQIPLWGTGEDGLVSTDKSMSKNFAVLKFGASCLMKMKDNKIFVVFWAVEDFVSNIRWIKLDVI